MKKSARENTYAFSIGDKLIGGNNPILIQTMSDIKTSKVEENVRFINECKKLGCDLVRFSVLDDEDCKALRKLKERSSLPLIADIHFNHNYALAALDAGFDKIRLNPGNIDKNHLDEVINKLLEKDAAIRVGVNSGSLGNFDAKDKKIVDNFLSAVDQIIEPLEKKGVKKIVISCKHSSPKITSDLYRIVSKKYRYPLHVGVTETGFGVQGIVKSCVGLIPILNEGIGNTIRISLTDSPYQEILACKTLLSNLGLKNNVLDIISCPTCGRTQVDVYNIVRIVQEKTKYLNKNVSIAVMGCPVNGPGEAKNATIGIAGGKNSFLLFKYGQIIGSYKQDEIIDILIEEVKKL